MTRKEKKAAVLARRHELAEHGNQKRIAREYKVSPKTISRWLSEPAESAKQQACREWPAPLRPRKPTAEEFDALLTAPPTAEEWTRAPDKADE